MQSQGGSDSNSLNAGRFTSLAQAARKVVPDRTTKSAAIESTAEPVLVPANRIDQPRQLLLPADPLFDAATSSAAERSSRWTRDQHRRWALALADAVVLFASGSAIVLLSGAPPVWAGAGVLPGLLAAKLIGLYDSDHRAIRHLTVDEVPAIALWCGVSATAASLIIPGPVVSTLMILIWFASVVASLALRGLARYVWRRTNPPERTLVLGEGKPAAAIARKIELFDDMHLVLDRVESPHEHFESMNGDEEAVMNRTLAGIDRVVLAWEHAEPRLIEPLVRNCRRLEVKLSVVSPFRGRARPALQLSQVAELPVLEYNTWDVSRSTEALKRGFDIAIAGAAMVALAPVFALAAIAIKLDGRGPVFFRQRRAGRGARPFTIVKFRTMNVDAEDRLQDFVNIEELRDPMFKLRGDPRITRVGRFLRRFSIDELPQLVNVLRGEMSLVGPRPEQLELVERYDADHSFRLDLKPGITGPMQIFGRGELSFEERLAVEMDYVENVSLSRDLKFVMQTLPAVVRGTGAF